MRTDGKTDLTKLTVSAPVKVCGAIGTPLILNFCSRQKLVLVFICTNWRALPARKAPGVLWIRECAKWEDNTHMNISKQDGKMWTGFSWFRTRIGGVILRMWQGIIGFRRRQSHFLTSGETFGFSITSLHRVIYLYILFTYLHSKLFVSYLVS